MAPGVVETTIGRVRGAKKNADVCGPSTECPMGMTLGGRTGSRRRDLLNRGPGYGIALRMGRRVPTNDGRADDRNTNVCRDRADDGRLGDQPSMSEDCLVLNVWTPSLDTEARLPVLVWLHGGGMYTGSASWPLYDFTNLANHRNVVMVGANHRLGILGFFGLVCVRGGIRGLRQRRSASTWRLHSAG